MSGREVLAEVRAALSREWAEHEDPVLAALNGCVLLTAEEANHVRRFIRPEERGRQEQRKHALGLLGAGDA